MITKKASMKAKQNLLRGTLAQITSQANLQTAAAALGIGFFLKSLQPLKAANILAQKQLYCSA